MTDYLITQFGATLAGTVARFSEGYTLSVSAATTYLEGRRNLRVAVYDPHTAVLKAVYGSDQEESPIEGVEFEFLETGCGAFTVNLNARADILAIAMGDRIDIHLMSTVNPSYSGRVTELPGPDTEGNFRVSGYGWSEVLGEVCVTEDYQGTGLEHVVLDLAAGYLTDGRVEWRSDEFMPVGYTVEHVAFDRVPLADALKSLAELAHDYVWGVDERRLLYFRPREGKPLTSYSNKASHWIGYHLEKFDLEEDAKDIENYLHVKIGAISEEDSTNFADFTTEDLDSIAFFGERQAVVSAPEIKSQEDAEAWAGYRLEEHAWPEVTARARGLDMAWMETADDLIRAEGFLRVSAPRSGMLAPYYEPMNGYFRWRDLLVETLYSTFGAYTLTAVRERFTARKGGRLGRVAIMVRNTGAVADLWVSIYSGASADTLVERQTIFASAVPSWWSWLTVDFDDVQVTAGTYYTVEVSTTGTGYEILMSTADATYTDIHCWYVWYLAPIGTPVSYTDRALLFRAWLVHEDEFVLAVKKAKYQATPAGGITADIDLGRIDQPLENHIVRLLRQLKAEELLQQSNVVELSA